MGQEYFLPATTYQVQRVADRSPRVHHSPHPRDERASRRKAAASCLKSKLRTSAGYEIKQKDHRRVSFQQDPPTRTPQQTLTRQDATTTVHPVYRRPSGRAGDVTSVDHQIARYGGSTSTLDCLPHRLRIAKSQPPATPQERIEELLRENGHLRRELTYYKDTRAVLMQMLEATKHSHQTLQGILTEAMRGVRISEQRYVAHWAPHHDTAYEDDVF